MLDHVIAITAYRTTDGDMGDPPGEPTVLTPTAAIAYLNADPRHALVITDLTLAPPHGANVAQGEYYAVFRGGSDRPDNFYVQMLPLEDPGDADGGDWTAEQAIAMALADLCRQP